ncbi:hypothetical protein GGX14DRAFT_565336 [Mycena pura]|uniref:Uncharacterized protein n=1 Tax=Mycena pura TaxID=153505 RepID=A0AAD6VI88_9AGAR|nr:hypothetical protein GGX14DRAFT_565336 [Mycena pura]
MDTTPAEVSFQASDWIGQGKQYKDVPMTVSAAFLRQLAPPDDILALHPARTLGVMDVLKMHFPEVSPALTSPNADTWFYGALQRLRDAASQHWLDGAQSIRDPRQRAELFLPLWAISVLEDLTKIANIREQWKAARWALNQSLGHATALSRVFSSAQMVLGDVGWNVDTQHGNWVFPTYTFAPLLKAAMLTDDVTQCIVNYLPKRLAENPVASFAHYLAPSRAYNLLENIAKKKSLLTGRLRSILQVVEDAVNQNPEVQVWFPVFRPPTDSGHQQILRVNFGTSRIAYGDSLPSWSPPTAVLRGVQMWLKNRFPNRKFSSGGRTIVCGVQEDGVSCIPASLNAFAAAALGDGLWTPETRELIRVQLFRRLVCDAVSFFLSLFYPSLRRRHTAPPRLSLREILNDPDPEDAAIEDAFDAAECPSDTNDDDESHMDVNEPQQSEH